MCNATIASTILEVLQQKIIDQEVFTSFDVTLEARKGTSDNVRHSDVRDIVGNEFLTGQMSGYNKELRTLNVTSSPQALVYFPNGKSADDHPLVESDEEDEEEEYEEEEEDEDALSGDLGDDEYRITKEGAVNIPRQMLTQVTASAGTYDILIGGSLKSVAPNKDGRVRIYLGKMWSDDNKIKLTVDMSKNTLNIEAV